MKTERRLVTLAGMVLIGVSIWCWVLPFDLSVKLAVIAIAAIGAVFLAEGIKLRMRE